MRDRAAGARSAPTGFGPTIPRCSRTFWNSAAASAPCQGREIGLATDIRGMQPTEEREEGQARYGELIASGGLQELDGLARIRVVPLQGGEGAERRKVGESDRRILRKAAVEIVGQCLGPGTSPARASARPAAYCTSRPPASSSASAALRLAAAALPDRPPTQRLRSQIARPVPSAPTAQPTPLRAVRSSFPAATDPNLPPPATRDGRASLPRRGLPLACATSRSIPARSPRKNAT